MTEALQFCPYCGARLQLASQRFCAGCGRALAAEPPPGIPVLAPATIQPAQLTTSAVDLPGGPEQSPAQPGRLDAPLSAGGSRPIAEPGSPPLPQLAGLGAAGTAVLRSGQAQIGDWEELREVGRSALYVIVGWLAMTLVAGFLLADAIRSSLAQQLVPTFASGDLMNSLVNATYGVIGSVFGGLGYRVNASSLGTSGSINFSVIPLGTLLTLGVLAGIGVRASLRRRPVTRPEALIVRVTLVAAAGAVAIYVVAMFLGVAYSASNVASLSGGPRMDDLLIVLFPVLWLGGAVGAVAIDPGWWAGTEKLRTRIRRHGPVLVAGIAGYVVGLLVVSLGICVWAAYELLTASGTTDWGMVVRMTPTIAAFLPNAAAVVMLGGSGTPFGTDTAGTAAPTFYGAGSLWQAGALVALASIAALVTPGFIAGSVLRGRVPTATPATVATVALVVVVLGLLAGSGALPSATATAQDLVQGAAQSTSITFDLSQAIVVGGLGILVSTAAGFQYGGPLWPFLARSVPLLMPVGGRPAA